MSPIDFFIWSLAIAAAIIFVGFALVVAIILVRHSMTQTMPASSKKGRSISDNNG